MAGIFCLIGLGAQAQFSEEPITKESSWRDRVFTGGNVGFGFGNVDWVNIAPVLGYRLSDRASIGLGGSYRFTNNKFFNPPIKTNDYGGNLFGRYLLYGPVFLQAEYEYLNFEFVTAPNESVRLDFSSFLGGGGIAQPLGRNVALVITALYNFSYANSVESPYDSPWVVRGGINLGF